MVGDFEDYQYFDTVGEPLAFWTPPYASVVMSKVICNESFPFHIALDSACELYDRLQAQTDELHKLAFWQEVVEDFMTVQHYVFRRFNTSGDLIYEESLFTCYIYDHA